MSRTHATALALVNWRGVFYERYVLDRNVTALEGVNGAGKTTVLIACYVVLLPDLTRLRFTNVGEHGSPGSDKGLWGRLGEGSRPAYAVLELRLADGARLLAGVHLERKAEPSIDPTPFIVFDLDESTRLQDLLLERGEMDAVPELAQVREQVARAGARLVTYASAKEYFAALFDLGVTPLRMAADADRAKLNEMLRTSMTGGISRALTSELRDFLLKEEPGLTDTLKSMRANLDACRRTRLEVEESRRLEKEIAGVYAAGQQMFASAIHATCERAEELHRRFDETDRAASDADRVERELADAMSAAKVANELLESQLQQIQSLLADARDLVARLKRAQTIKRRMNERRTELLKAQQQLDSATEARDQADVARQRARLERAAARTAHDRAAAGLADFQKGLDELHRRAAEYSLTTRRLDEARQFLAGEPVNVEAVLPTLLATEQRHDAVSKDYRRAENAVVHSQQHRQEFEEVLASLLTITDGPIPVVEAFARAQATLAELRELDLKMARKDTLPKAIHDLRQLVAKQGRARDAARQLSSSEFLLTTASSVHSALEALEAAVDTADRQSRNAEHLAEAAKTRLAGFADPRRRLELALAAWKNVLVQVESLEQRFNVTLRTRESVLSLRARLERDRETHRSQLAALRIEQTRVRDEASQIEQCGGDFSGALLRARDAVDGELLASRFEELGVADAGEAEASLGPLAEAIVVNDTRLAAQVLSQLDEKPTTVWLVAEDVPLPLDANGKPTGEIIGKDVLVDGPIGSRLSTIPQRPTLGRRAREARVRDLRSQAQRLTEQIESIENHLRSITNALTATEHLVMEVATVERGDPSAELASIVTATGEAAEQERVHRGIAAESQRAIDALRSRRVSLRELLASAWLLDEPDQSAQLSALQNELFEVKAAAARLNNGHVARRLVEQRLAELRVPPPTDEALAQLRIECERLRSAQDELLRAMQALRYVHEHRAALDWADAEVALRRRTALEPALQAQLDNARLAATTADGAVDSADAVCEQAVDRCQSIHATVKGLTDVLQRDGDEWRECRVDNADSDTVRDAEAVVVDRESDERGLQTRGRELAEQVARLDERLKAAAKHAEDCRRQRDDAERSWQPAQVRWDQLQSIASERGVLATAMTRTVIDAFTGRGSANLRTEARSQAATLKERLSHARDSDHVLKTVGDLLGSQELSGEACLEAWIEVRDWLRRRIPAQIAEVDEPLDALERLRGHLTGLEERLTRQEADLRGSSEDVARNIEIHIRRSQRQINRLNQDLNEVRFGTIHGVQVRLERVERMEQVLGALQGGEAQALLFQPDMPIEAALDELFRRYGGRTTGQRLLDYREYIEPKVEVRRQAGTGWESANPVRMSTGEAIGVGAALMMVVLTAWERDANLLRPKRSMSTLRLLFLDEANRLSQDNLGVLFDLCQNLDLQLIIAAPEVARAEGNTTYRLVRRVTDSGHEEVIVTGRRLAGARAS